MISHQPQTGIFELSRVSSPTLQSSASSATEASHGRSSREVPIQIQEPATVVQQSKPQCSNVIGEASPRTTVETEEPPYSVLSAKQKLHLVLLVSVAGSFSPLSSNIYFPAVETISTQLGVSSSLIALTITIYMVIQGISPSIFGTISDASGRRLAFALSLAVYTIANVALAFTSNYPMLLVLRAVQAMGSAATISISTGVIADIATPGERGGFMGTNAGVRYAVLRNFAAQITCSGLLKLLFIRQNDRPGHWSGHWRAAKQQIGIQKHILVSLCPEYLNIRAAAGLPARNPSWHCS